MDADHSMLSVIDQPNINYLWAALLVEELRRQGVEYFFLAPGSRSAPLLFAAGNDKRVHSVVHFDERALAFMACGYASSSGKPAVLVCTSGTAAANFLPGIIEASKKKLPLIVLTADRPPELQKTGAAQCIEQPGMYGAYVRWAFDMPCPTMEILPEFVLTTAGLAVSRAKGELPGPVHLNVMFREPLAPVKQNKNLTRYLSSLRNWVASDKSYTVYEPKGAIVTESALKDAQSRLGRIRNALILVGKLSSPADRQAILLFAEKTGFPIFADVTSGLRLGCRHPNVIAYFDRILSTRKGPMDFDGVIHFGGRMTSRRCYEALTRMALKEYLMVIAHPLRSDPLHKVTARFVVGPAVFIDGVLPLLGDRVFPKALSGLRKADQTEERRIERTLSRSVLSEPAIARMVTKIIPAGSGLFLSNSMPVRDMDSFASRDGRDVVVGANRGASGIDGIIASAIGFAEGLKSTTTLVIGDLAFLYDLNALALLVRAGQKLVIVAINNDGGGIFTLLPVYERSPVFQKCFTAPHGISFRSAASLFGLKYDAPGSLTAFKRDYTRALGSKGSTVIEVRVPRRKS